MTASRGGAWEAARRKETLSRNNRGAVGGERGGRGERRERDGYTQSEAEMCVEGHGDAGGLDADSAEAWHPPPPALAACSSCSIVLSTRMPKANSIASRRAHRVRGLRLCHVEEELG